MRCVFFIPTDPFSSNETTAVEICSAAELPAFSLPSMRKSNTPVDHSVGIEDVARNDADPINPVQPLIESLEPRKSKVHVSSTP
jgi:hypothetical protein